MATRIDLSTLTLMDALDLATLIEAEAYKRYMMFADQFGRGGEGPGSLFASMGENEAKHGKHLSAQRQAKFGDIQPRLTLDDLFDVEAPEMGAPRRTMSLLQAFELGVAAEQKAYDFYDQALPNITDPDVRALFIELRDEETEHVNTLREAMAVLPPSASIEGEIDMDESPYL
jgi:demethoxyubiquinone hydroxylase (CLK1/Coq7/Cat5 family)